MEREEQSGIIEMSCMEVRALNAGYLEGDLGLDAYIRVDAHLEHCRYCSAIYDGVCNVLTLLASDELFVLPAGFDDRLYDALRRPDGAQAN